MKLQDIEKMLEASRSNGIYFRSKSWDTPVFENTRPFAYLSKKGSLFMTVIHPYHGKRQVLKFDGPMQTALQELGDLEIWDGSL